MPWVPLDLDDMDSPGCPGVSHGCHGSCEDFVDTLGNLGMCILGTMVNRTMFGQTENGHSPVKIVHCGKPMVDMVVM